MLNRFLRFLFWFKFFLVFKTPRFISINFADCIFENKAYLLIQWEFQNAFHLSIKELKYNSFNSSSSTYILLPKDIDEVQIQIRSSWKKQTKVLKLNKSVLPFELERRVLADFKSFKKSSFQIVNPKAKNEKVTLLNTSVTLKNLYGYLEIVNLNYP